MAMESKLDGCKTTCVFMLETDENGKIEACVDITRYHLKRLPRLERNGMV